MQPPQGRSNAKQYGDEGRSGIADVPKPKCMEGYVYVGYAVPDN